MSLFGKNKNIEPEIVAVFDIGSGVVSAALVEINKNIKPTILVSVSEDILSAQEMSFGELFGATESAIYRLSQKLLLEKRSAPNSVYCFLSSPWYAGQTRIIKLSKQKEFEFTKKIWQDLLEKESKKFLDKTVSVDADAVLIEKKNMSVTLDGQKTMSPLGVKVKSVELSVFFSISSGNVLKAFRHSIERSFSVPVEFSSFMFSSFITVRDLFHKKELSSLVIDIGSKITEIGIVEDDVLTSIASFPFGLQSIEHSIMDTFDVSKTETQSLLSIYNKGKMESSRSKKIKNIVSKEIDTWYTMFTKTIDSFKTNDIPHNVYILIDEGMESLFDFDKRMKIVDGAMLPIHIIDGKTFSSYVRLVDVKHRNPFLMLESLFITRI